MVAWSSSGVTPSATSSLWSRGKSGLERARSTKGMVARTLAITTPPSSSMDAAREPVPAAAISSPRRAGSACSRRTTATSNASLER